MIELIPLALTFLVVLLPGVVFSFGFFSGTKFNKLDKLFAGVIFGLLVVPLLLYLENILFGMALSLAAIFANWLLFIIFGTWLAFSKRLIDIKKVTGVVQNALVEFETKPLTFVAPILLVLTVLFAFYLRTAFSYFSNFFEFDPYYYMSLTETLVRQGTISLTSDLAYFPLDKFNHEPGLVAFMTGAWYLLYQLFNGAAVYSKETLIFISNFYPPLVGALLSVVVYWLLRAHYDELAALAGAVFAAATPILIHKFAFGVAELQPMGIFSAILMFSAFLLSLKYRQWQFYAFAGFATIIAIIGAAQYVWPVGVIAAFFLIQAFINYYSSHDDDYLLINAVVFALCALIGNVFINLYSGSSPFAISTVVLLAMFSVAPAVVFHFISKMPQFAKYSRGVVIGAILLIGIVVALLPVLPNGNSLSEMGANFISGTAGFAQTGSPLGKTIAEESATGFGENAMAYGVLSPIILVILAMFLVWAALETLLLRREYKLAALFLVASLAIVLLRVQIADFAITFGTSTGLLLSKVAGNLLKANELFSFLLISILASTIAFIKAEKEHRSEAGLLTSLILYPVAYIGLNKVKFIVHLSAALVIGAGVLIGELSTRGKFLHSYFKIGKSGAETVRWTFGFALLIALLLISIQVFGFQNKAPGAVPAAQSLQYSRLSGDWLSAMQWLNNNTNYNDPAAQARCRAEFGHDCRVISWWDYGHWTVFLGETKTVLDPSNVYPNFDQEVAYGFVDNQSAFLSSLQYHNASHVLVDYELIEKWGALVFLSGTCKKYKDNSTDIYGITCPVEPRIKNWQAGPSKDIYELEHYFETLQLNGACPFSQSMGMLQGSFGGAYCISQTELIPLDRSGLRTDLARPFTFVDLTKSTANVSADMHYLIPIGQNVFVDANPDLRVINQQSKAIDSTFARLYMFENLPGFQLVYRSPSGEVKLFKKVS